MGLITYISTSIDQTMIGYVEDVFNNIAAPMRILLNSMAILALLFLALNHILQFKTVSMAVYFSWFLRFILIYSVGTFWVNFEGIYNIFVELPSDYSTLLIKSSLSNIKTISTEILDPARIKDSATAMDEFTHALTWISSKYLSDVSIFDIGGSIKNVFLGALILIIAGIFTAIAAVVLAFAKIGFAVAMCLAPLAIVLLMMEQTKQYFDSWLRFLVGFVVLPILVTALMSIILYVAGEILASSGASAEHKDRFFAFIFIMAAALILLSQLPTMASTLASSSVAVVGASAASARSMMRNSSRLHSLGQRARDGVGVANSARKAGASPSGIAMSAISGFRQSAGLRQARRDDRLADRIKGAGGEKKAPRRYHEGSSSAQAPSRSDTPEQQNLNRP